MERRWRAWLRFFHKFKLWRCWYRLGWSGGGFLHVSQSASAKLRIRRAWFKMIAWLLIICGWLRIALSTGNGCEQTCNDSHWRSVTPHCRHMSFELVLVLWEEPGEVWVTGVDEGFRGRGWGTNLHVGMVGWDCAGTLQCCDPRTGNAGSREWSLPIHNWGKPERAPPSPINACAVYIYIYIYIYILSKLGTQPAFTPLVAPLYACNTMDNDPSGA